MRNPTEREDILFLKHPFLGVFYYFFMKNITQILENLGSLYWEKFSEKLTESGKIYYILTSENEIRLAKFIGKAPSYGVDIFSFIHSEWWIHNGSPHLEKSKKVEYYAEVPEEL